jgi:hypothetical protein
MAVTPPPDPVEVVSPELALVDPSLRRAAALAAPTSPAPEERKPEVAPPAAPPAGGRRRRVSAATAVLLLLAGAAAGAVAGAVAMRGRDRTTTATTTLAATAPAQTTTVTTTTATARRPVTGSGYVAAGGLRFRLGNGVLTDISVPLQCAAAPAPLPPLRLTPGRGFSFDGTVRERGRRVRIRLAGTFVDATVVSVAVSESARGCTAPTRIYLARLS